mgnify:FL=1
MPNPTNNKLVDSKTIAALFDMTPRRVQQLTKDGVIAAVKDDDGLQNALQNENIRVVFILYGDICNISTLVQRIHTAGKFAIVHVDLIAGLASKEVAVDFILSLIHI